MSLKAKMHVTSYLLTRDQYLAGSQIAMLTQSLVWRKCKSLMDTSVFQRDTLSITPSVDKLCSLLVFYLLSLSLL